MTFGRRSFRAALAAVLAMVTAGLSACASPVGREDPHALWRVVHGLCVRDERLLRAPAPCLAVDLDRGYAVVKDPKEKSHLLLVPIRRITGVEDPKLQEPGSPNYWQAAWDQRARFERLVGKPVGRDDIGLAVNSLYGRTQDQLHIHIDCIKPSVPQAIAWQLKSIGPAWRPLRGRVLGTYFARRLYGEDFGDRDPFKLVVHGLPQTRGDMAGETLAAVGMTFPDGRPGFVLLARQAELERKDLAAAEALLDHSCAAVGGQRR